MKKLSIKRLLAEAPVDQRVAVAGWVRSKRESKNFAFITLSDGSCAHNLQLVVDAAVPAFALLKDIATGAALSAQGILRASPGAGQKCELHVEQLEVIGEAPASDYPLQKKGHSLEFLREIAHLRPRTNTFGAVFRCRNTLANLVHRFFQERDFIWAQTPILTASDCEGAGEMFQVSTLDLKNPPRLAGSSEIDFSKDFFGKPAHLTVSGQLEGEFLALSLGNVYTFGPTFRAENSNTARHLAEFWMIEPEIAFADINDDMDLAEEFLRWVIGHAVELCADDLQLLASLYKTPDIEVLKHVANTPFARISYTEAVELLIPQQKHFQFPVAWGSDLQTEHERFLTEKIFKGPVIVYNYPKDIKAFYMRLNDDGKTVAGMDVLVPGVGEIIGGSQREDRLPLLEKRMQEMKIPINDLQWYLDLRRYGSVPHAGFGLGFERLVMYVTGMQNIRDVILCPRTPGSIGF
jgi:asparaginyl-tRNA synthetase